MPDYRRVRIGGGTYFFTLVANRREPYFAQPVARKYLARSLAWLRANHPFTLDAAVVLPDHLHLLMTQPDGDADYATRIMLLKKRFTHLAKEAVKLRETEVTLRASARGEASFWQRRYWEHAIRSAEDFQNHLEYIFFNPVKHGLVKRVADWPFSSFHRYANEGKYAKDWAGSRMGPTGGGLRAGE